MKKSNKFYLNSILILLLILTPDILFSRDKNWFLHETPEQKAQRLKWWTRARFGMFIHWGTYSLGARNEWVKYREHIPDREYSKYFKHFNPDMYDPAQWAKLARYAGMKYVVITAKHHEGFCLWDTRYTDYKVTNTPYGKDLLKPFVEAFRKEGLRVGFYYSLLDWHHPEYPIDKYHPMFINKEYRERENQRRDMKKYARYIRNQLRELLTQFGEIDLLFLDYSFPGKYGKGRKEWESMKILKLVRTLQPQIIINDRLDLLDVPGGWDFRTPEQFMPRQWVTYRGKRVPWETCQTISGYWGYYRDGSSWKSVQQLIIMLIETVSKGGNLLLNVGPTARGTFDPWTVERLRGIGNWMKFHSRSIYGCTRAPREFKKPENCLLTYNPDTRRLYVHVLVWPSTGKLYLEGFAGKVEYAQLLNDASEIKFTEPKHWNVLNEKVKPETLILKLPIQKPPVDIPVIELFLKR